MARLHADPAFHARLAAQFEPGGRLRYHLAPPLLARRDPVTGHLRKRAFGGWMLPVFRVLARLRGLRGTPFDVFGYTAERRGERALATQYEALLGRIAAQLAPHNHAQAVELAGASLAVRGYGHVKEASIARATAQETALWQAFLDARPAETAVPAQGAADPVTAVA